MAYEKINWKSGKTGGTLVNSTNLNKMDKGIYDNSIDIESIKEKNTTQDTKIETLETSSTDHQGRITQLENKSTQLETKNTEQDELITELQNKNNEQQELITELETEVNELKDNVLTNEVEGTNIYVDDSANARVLELGIDGNSYQEVRSGKNLFDGIFESGNINNSGANYDDTTSIRSANYVEVNPNSDYIISDKGTALQVNIAEYDENKNFISRTYFNRVNITTKENTKYIRFATSTITNPLIQIEQGTTATEYEQYGASPSPDYPSEVEVVKGYNLFDETIEPELYFYNSAGIKTEDNLYYINQKVENIEPGKIYLISWEYRINSANIRICEYQKDGTFIRRSLINTNNYAIQIRDNTSYIIVSVDNTRNGTSLLYFEKLRIIKGTTPKPYVPYQNIGIKTTGKNLFNKEVIKFYANNFNAFENTSNVNNVRLRTSSFNLKEHNLKHNVIYEISGIPSGWTLTSVRTYTGTIFLDDATTYSIIGNKFSILNEKVDYIHLLFKNDNSTEIAVSDFENSDIQLEEGNATPYEPYQENITYIDLQDNEICQVGDIKDELDLNTGILTKRIGKVVLNGSESWAIGGENSYFYSFFESMKITPKPNSEIKTTHFINSRTNGAYIGNTSLAITLNCLPNMTAEDFKTWVSENPVTVYYQLATPYEVNLGKIEMPNTINHVTNINLLSTLETNMKLKYVRSTNVVIENLAKAIVALGGEV